MDRIVRTIKDQNGKETEVYVDTCSICSIEMLFPKEYADKMQELFPFLIEKVKNGSPCMECVKKKLEEDPSYSPFSQEEINEIRRKFETYNEEE